MKSIFIYHHLGLGDHIICNGMIRAILANDSPHFLYLPVKTTNIDSVREMYADDERIVCLPVENDNDVPGLPHLQFCSKVYRAGFEKCRVDWDVSFYDSVGIPFDARWKSFRINRNAEQEQALYHYLNPNHEPFVLIHSAASNAEYQLDVDTDLKQIAVTPTTAAGHKPSPISFWCLLIESATEVHYIDSSFIHLAQSIGVNRGVFHNIRPLNIFFSLHPSWEIQDYRTNNED
jgi:hypothetical protein